jgi:hypothetical protein
MTPSFDTLGLKTTSGSFKERWMKTSIAIAAVLAFAGAAVAQNDGAGDRIALVLDGGWTYDQLDIAGGPTTGSPIQFTLIDPAYFRITDDFNVGDIWTAIGIGSTTFNGGQAPTIFGGEGEAAWQSPDYSHFEIILAPGDYSFDMTGDGAGGLPAGFYIQLETIPTPGAMTLLGLGGLVAARRRR